MKSNCHPNPNPNPNLNALTLMNHGFHLTIVVSNRKNKNTAIGKQICKICEKTKKTQSELNDKFKKKVLPTFY